MEQPKGHPCPECGAPRQPDNTPSCACTERAAEALRETRTAEAAAAEDFDPLRIRPYVELEGGTAGPPAADTTALLPADPAATPPADPTVPLPAVAPEVSAPRATPPGSRPPYPASGPGSADTTAGADTGTTATTARHETATPPRDHTGVTATTAPYDTGITATAAAYGTGARPRPRRRRTAVLAAVGALVGVVAAAGYASGLFSYETPSRDTALPDDIRASVPDASTTPPSTTPAPARPAPAAPAPPRAGGSPAASASPSPSASTSTPSPSPTQSASASASPLPTASGTRDSMEAPDDRGRQKTIPVLRRGDQGPEVTELQLRLRQLLLYNGEADGVFTTQLEDSVRTYQWSRGIGSDEPGVYGQETRTKLESETTEP
ncbi:peptidoglycan-binding domain-containing protein [Streptomyces sp. NPDC052682]|uniref:peptidoglycan-binding domain-containing protein n=1 Tax=Streptomyces sp. NPDC052682 TaxID=3154954 RepID=UPI003428B6B2